MASDKKIDAQAIKDAGKKAGQKIGKKVGANLEAAKSKSKEMMADKKFKKNAAIGAAAIGSAAIAAALLYASKRSKDKKKSIDISKFQETD